MEITKVRVKLVDMQKVRALASITIDDCFVVHDLRVVHGDSGVFVAMPSRKLPTGEFRDTAHPVDASTRNLLQDVVLAEYNRVLGGTDLAGERSQQITNDIARYEEARFDTGQTRISAP